MKHTSPIFSIAVAAIVGISLASCSQDEPAMDVNHGKSIDFRAALTSRATETNNSNLTDFKATAFLGDTPYFSNVTFSKASGSSFYTSADDYYWPGDDSELSFLTYSPVDLSGVTIDATKKVVTDFTPATDIASQIDFVSAKATGKKSVNEAAGVPLDFNHNLSQIEVRGLTNNKLYRFKVTGVRIGQPVSSGSFDFDADAWTLGSDKAIYESTYATPLVLEAKAQSLMGDNGNAMLVPQQLVAWDVTSDNTNTQKGAYLSVKLQINILDADGNEGVQIYPFPSDAQCIWAAIPIDTNWEAGKKYIYTLDFTHGAGYVDPHDPEPGKPVLGGPIKFTVNVVDWVESTQDLDMHTSTSADNN